MEFHTSEPPSSSYVDRISGENAIRCVNVVNFIREIEPRFKIDMMLPVMEQMRLIVQHKLPATWLLQFDALVSGPYVPFLKAHVEPNHEVGLWFEMNEKHCQAAGVEWRGRAGFEWDSTPSVAFTIGYTPDERAKLAEIAMKRFKEIWGYFPRSIASWNLDAFTMAYLNDRYRIDAYAVCRDQIATDGFTIWGAPIAGYYPSKVNCWIPAVDHSNQLSTPVFRMLGQDPVYYYQKEWKVPGCRPSSVKYLDEPDTMEPAWTSGQTPSFVAAFLNMISCAPSQKFAYCQLGQENTFEWHLQEDGYQMQMNTLADLRNSGQVYIETMSSTGRRFQQAFHTTPTQAQVQLHDPFNNRKSPQNSIWYQSRFYRANLHLKDDCPFLRDITVYSDDIAQPFLDEATREVYVEQKMPAIMDAYHWSKYPGMYQDGGVFFYSEGQRLSVTQPPRVKESENALEAVMAVDACGDARLCVIFEQQTVGFSLGSKESGLPLSIAFEWDPEKAPLIEMRGKTVKYSAKQIEFHVGVLGGFARITENGWMVVGGERGVVLSMAQRSMAEQDCPQANNI